MPSEAALWLGAIRARSYVRIIGSNREPSWWITEVALPVLAMCGSSLAVLLAGATSGS